MRRLAALLLVALTAAPAALAAAPAKAPVFGLRAVGNNQRGYFVYTLTAGAVQHGTVIVSNVGNAAGTVHLFVADGTTGPTSGTVYKTDTAPTATGKWVQLSSTSLTLPAGGHKSVPFTVTVPSNAQSGQWVAGIVAETSHKEATQKPGAKARVQIRIRDLTIVAVQVNVPGPPIVSFSIGKVTTGGTRGFQKVIVHLENTGNVLAKPTGVITIYDSKGHVVETLSFTMDTFLPHTAIDYPVLLKKALPAGSYSASVRLTVPGAHGKIFAAKPVFAVTSTDVKQVFTSAPPQAPPVGAAASSSTIPSWAWYALAAAGLLVVVLLVVWLLLRGRRARDRRPPTTFVRSPSALAAEQPAAPAPVEPTPVPAPVLPLDPPAPPPPPEPEPEPAAASAACEPYHYWEVAYDRGVLGDDGAWRFPHRCRQCGAEVLARDVADASAQAPVVSRS